MVLAELSMRAFTMSVTRLPEALTAEASVRVERLETVPTKSKDPSATVYLSLEASPAAPT